MCSSGVGRSRINSHLEKTGEDELNIKNVKLDAKNFKKAETLNTLMIKNTINVSTKEGTEESGVRVSKDEKKQRQW